MKTGMRLARGINDQPSNFAPGTFIAKEKLLLVTPAVAMAADDCGEISTMGMNLF